MLGDPGPQREEALTRLHQMLVRIARSEVSAAARGSDLRLMQGIGTVPTIHYGPGTPGSHTALASACPSMSYLLRPAPSH